MKVYNTLTRQLEPLRPGKSGTLGIYCCGVTVYDRSHLGHALSAVVLDVVVRFLRDRFGSDAVRYVVNFTDIDDKILETARAEGVSWKELSQRHIETYFEDMDRMNVARADVYPKASEHVPQMVELIRELEAKNLAYVVEGDGVYYRVRGFEGYGKLSGRGLEDLQEEGRVGRDERFDHPADFCLWKFWDHPDAWDSPWGKGRPGWHIECSAMAAEHLGQPLDVHAGGLDLKFPHHENEIAQSEGARGAPFSRIWMHHGLLNVKGSKVSKSVGNVLDIQETVGRYGVGAIRHYFLGHLYRNPLTFEQGLLEDAATAYARIFEVRARVAEVLERPPIPVGMDAVVLELQNEIHSSRSKFSEGMEDDFNTAEALAAIHELVRSLNRTVDVVGHGGGWAQLREALQAATHVLDRMMKVLGFVDPDGKYLPLPVRTATDSEMGKLVDLLLELRTEARGRKDFDTADKIRQRLEALDFELQDGPDGTTWKRR